MEPVANNVVVVLQASNNSVLKGSVQIAGFTNGIRIQSYPDVIFLDPFRPTRAGNRNLTNSVIQAIRIVIPIGEAMPMSFQALCDGNDLGTITVTELISDGKTAQSQRVLSLTNAYVIDWEFQGSRDGGDCVFVLTFDQLQQTRTALGQNEKSKGKTAVTANKNQKVK